MTDAPGTSGETLSLSNIKVIAFMAGYYGHLGSWRLMSPWRKNPPDVWGLLRRNYTYFKEYASGKSVKVCCTCLPDFGHSVQNVTMPKSTILYIAHDIAHDMLNARG